MKGKKAFGIFLTIGLLIVGFSLVSAFEVGKKSPIIVSGKWQIDPKIREKALGVKTLYFVIYDVDNPMPMPYGAVREKLIRIPGEGEFVEFFITKEKIQTMIPDAPLPKKLRLKLRIDKDGLAGRDQPGDLTGELSPVQLGTTDALLRIEKYIDASPVPVKGFSHP